MNNDALIMRFAQTMLQNNPKAANSPMGQQLASILNSGNYSQGVELANNLCSSMQMDPKQAASQAFQGFFGHH